jgi:O-antigen ligase
MNSASDDVSTIGRPGRAWRLLYDCLPALGLITYFVILLVPYWWLSDWYDLVDTRETSATLPYQAAGFLMFSASVLPLAIRTLGRNEFITLSTPRGVFVLGFFAFCLAFLVLTEAPGVRPVLYVLLTWALFVFGAAFWSADYGMVKRGLGWAGVIVLAFLVVLLFMHGLTSPGTARRAVGGIQPNQYGRVALAGLVLTFFLPRWLTYPAAAMAVILMVLVSSRSALLGAAIFLFCYLLLTVWSTTSFQRLLAFTTVSLALAAGALAVETYLLFHGSSLFTLLSEKILLVNDPARGLGSGFTGRTEAWLEGLRALAERPLFGYGFRRQEVRAHNGYLNLMLDVGIPLAVWFIAFIVVEIGRRIGAIHRLRLQAHDIALREELLLHRIIGAFLISALITWIFEPNYLNLGIPYTILFIAFLAAPHRFSYGRFYRRSRPQSLHSCHYHFIPRNRRT